jgi:hypothetical protein
VWALRAARSCRRQVSAGRVDTVELPSAAAVPAEAAAGVRGVLRRLPCRCLTRVLVLQAWRADHGDPVDVVIGVTAPAAGFTAHAWLADADDADRGHEPIHRVTPRPRPRPRPGPG